jgi:hypothetical protein
VAQHGTESSITPGSECERSFVPGCIRQVSTAQFLMLRRRKLFQYDPSQMILRDQNPVTCDLCKRPCVRQRLAGLLKHARLDTIRVLHKPDPLAFRFVDDGHRLAQPFAFPAKRPSRTAQLPAGGGQDEMPGDDDQ